MPTSSARSGGSRPTGCAATASTRLMNYPLGEAILGFAGGSHLDMEIVSHAPRVPACLRPLDGPAFAERVDRAGERLRPRRRRGPAQPRRLARRAAAADGPRRRCAPVARLATLLQATLPGRPVDLLRRRGRADGRPRPGLPAARSRGTRAAGSRACAIRSGRSCTCAAPSRVCATRRFAWPAPPDRRSPSSAARGRRASSSRSTRGRARPARPPTRGPRRWDRRTSSRSTSPGLGGITASAIEDGRATLELPARSGSVLRIR